MPARAGAPCEVAPARLNQADLHSICCEPLFIVFLIALLPAHVRAKARIALLIGNQAYKPKVGKLRNPHDDIALVGTALRSLARPWLGAGRFSFVDCQSSNCGGSGRGMDRASSASRVRRSIRRLS